MQLRFGNSFRFNVYLQIRWFVYKGCFIPHSKLKDKLRELVQPCFIKKNVQRRYKYLVQGRDRSYFVKKKHTLILPKIYLKLISSPRSSFWLTTYLFYLVDVFSTHGDQLFSSTCSFIRMRQTSYRGLSRKTKIS